MTDQTEELKTPEEAPKAPKPGSNAALKAKVAELEAELAAAKKDKPEPTGQFAAAAQRGTKNALQGVNDGVEQPSAAEVRELRKQQKRKDMTEEEEELYEKLRNPITGIPPVDVRGVPGSFTVKW